MSLAKFFDVVVPRFVTDKAAAVWDEDGSLQPICSINDLREDDVYDCIVELKAFNFFGYGLFPKFIRIVEGMQQPKNVSAIGQDWFGQEKPNYPNEGWK